MENKYKTTSISVGNIYKVKGEELQLLQESIMIELSWQTFNDALYRELFSRTKFKLYNYKTSKENDIVISDIKSIIPYCSEDEIYSDRITEKRLFEIYREIVLSNEHNNENILHNEEKIKRISKIYSKLK